MIVCVKLTVVALVLAVLADCTTVVPPEYHFRRYVYRKKTKSVCLVCHAKCFWGTVVKNL